MLPQRYHCFASDHVQASEWFVEAAHAAGARLEAATHPSSRGPSGEPLRTHFAWFGPPDAERVLVTVSGTHGQEFFAGAATQLDWICGGGAERIPAGVAVCLVHAYNAFGAAYMSRTNERNVDLNRNFRHPSQPVPDNPRYHEVHELLCGPGNDEQLLQDRIASLEKWVEREGTAALARALDAGQDTHPDGLIYRGTGEQWETATLRSLADGWLSGGRTVALIDWHTGLGAFGEAMMMFDHAATSEEYRWATTWWGRSIGPVVGSVAPEAIGYVKAGLAAHLRRSGARVASTVIEWGTFDSSTVTIALLLDRWLRLECVDRGSAAAGWNRARMMEALNPASLAWRQAVIAGARRIHESTLQGLAFWP